MFAIKSNKQYTIAAEQTDEYAAVGYDIYGEEMELVKRGAGSSVSYETYEAALKENEELKAALASAGE